MLEKYAAVTKQDVLDALRTYFLPLFDPATSVAVVVTAPSKAADIDQELVKLGFETEQRSLHIDADEEDADSDSGSDSESGSEMSTESR